MENIESKSISFDFIMEHHQMIVTSLSLKIGPKDTTNIEVLKGFISIIFLLMKRIQKDFPEQTILEDIFGSARERLREIMVVKHSQDEKNVH